MSEEIRSRALSAALNVEEAIRRASANVHEIAEMSNEDLLDMERRFSALDDQLGLVWKFYGLERARREADGRIERKLNPIERMLSMAEPLKGATPPLNVRSFLITSTVN